MGAQDRESTLYEDRSPTTDARAEQQSPEFHEQRRGSDHGCWDVSQVEHSQHTKGSSVTLCP